MFYDKKFKLNYVVDKRGCFISYSIIEDLKCFYDFLDFDFNFFGEDSKVLS